MTRQEEIKELKNAIKMTTSSAERTKTPAILEMHLRAIINYKKRLALLEDPCYMCNDKCGDCVLVDIGIKENKDE